MAGIAVEVFGLKIGIRVRDPQVLDSLLSCVPIGWTPLDSVLVDRLYSIVTPTAPRRNIRQLHVLYGDQGRLIRTEHFLELLACLESDLDLYIAGNSPDSLFVHAGAVRWKHYTILMPGRSQTGKTTLVAGFLGYGASYYSDDFAVLDHTGHVHPYPRGLSIRTCDNAIQRVRPEDFGAVRAKPSSVSLVLFTEYATDSSWSPARISHGQGMLRMLQNTPSARKQPTFALKLLANATKDAELHVGYRGERDRTVERVLNYLEGRSLS